MSEQREFTAVLRLVGGRTVERKVKARTPQLAAVMAEQSEVEARCLSVTSVWKVTARCGSCEQPIFDGDQVRHRNNTPRCFDCG